MTSKYSMWGLIAVLCVAGVVGCDTELRVNASSESLEIYQGVMYYNGEPLTGIMVTDLPGARRESTYANGRQHGPEIKSYYSGRVAAERTFHEGLKVGIHRGWYPGGKMHFHFEFEEGQHHGDAWQWHPDGGLASYERYDHGRLIGRKAWRRTGKVFHNYVNIENKVLVGLRGGRLCNGVTALDVAQYDAEAER